MCNNVNPSPSSSSSTFSSDNSSNKSKSNTGIKKRKEERKRRDKYQPFPSFSSAFDIQLSDWLGRSWRGRRKEGKSGSEREREKK